MNPYLVLAVPLEANDQAIRQAYLTAVKESPPETDPKRFQAVSQAYDQIKDRASRHAYILFNRDCPGQSPLDVLPQFAAAKRVLPPLPLEAMKELLAAMAKPGSK